MRPRSTISRTGTQGPSEIGSAGAGLAKIAARASEDAKGAPADLLEGYLQLLVDVSATGRRLVREELDSRHALGARAAEQGTPLRAVVDLYLSATWLAWPLLPGVIRAKGTDELRFIGEALFRAADASIIALAEGYEHAQRLAIRQEEALRQEFIDDLLYGRNLGRLAERAERFGLRLARAHVVAVAQAARPFLAADPTARRVETALLARFGTRDILVTAKEGLLTCVAPETLDKMPDEFARQVEVALGRKTGWRVGLGRAHEGPGGVVRSFEQARNALHVAHRLGLNAPVLKASDLLVFQVLLRDEGALAELVTTVLGPLRGARGGPGPLLETLSAYFASGGVATLAARHLHLSVRTITYRLERIRELTGYAASDPTQRFTLETAVLGARLLGWPNNT